MVDDHARVWREFKALCIKIAEGKETPDKVVPINSVLADARKHYKIYPKEKLIQLIADGGLEQISFVNKKPWEKNFTQFRPLDVYAFNFKTLHLPGYLAIIENKSMGNWLIKSFHPPPIGSNPTLADIFPIISHIKEIP